MKEKMETQEKEYTRNHESGLGVLGVKLNRLVSKQRLSVSRPSLQTEMVRWRMWKIRVAYQG